MTMIRYLLLAMLLTMTVRAQFVIPPQAITNNKTITVPLTIAPNSVHSYIVQLAGTGNFVIEAMAEAVSIQSSWVRLDSVAENGVIRRTLTITGDSLMNVWLPDDSGSRGYAGQQIKSAYYAKNLWKAKLRIRALASGNAGTVSLVEASTAVPYTPMAVTNDGWVRQSDLSSYTGITPAELSDSLDNNPRVPPIVPFTPPDETDPVWTAAKDSYTTISALTDTLNRIPRASDGVGMNVSALTDTLNLFSRLWMKMDTATIGQTLDSKYARSGGMSIDTTRFVSMDRDDTVKGEKMFGGTVTLNDTLKIGPNVTIKKSASNDTLRIMQYYPTTAGTGSISSHYFFGQYPWGQPYGGYNNAGMILSANSGGSGGAWLTLRGGGNGCGFFIDNSGGASALAIGNIQSSNMVITTTNKYDLLLSVNTATWNGSNSDSLRFRLGVRTSNERYMGYLSTSYLSRHNFGGTIRTNDTLIAPILSVTGAGSVAVIDSSVLRFIVRDSVAASTWIAGDSGRWAYTGFTRPQEVVPNVLGIGAIKVGEITLTFQVRTAFRSPAYSQTFKVVLDSANGVQAGEVEWKCDGWASSGGSVGSSREVASWGLGAQGGGHYEGMGYGGETYFANTPKYNGANYVVLAQMACNNGYVAHGTIKIRFHLPVSNTSSWYAKIIEL